MAYEHEVHGDTEKGRRRNLHRHRPCAFWMRFRRKDKGRSAQEHTGGNGALYRDTQSSQ